MDKEGNCSCSLWLLFTFPRCWGSAVAFLIPVLAFSSVLCSAMMLGHAPCAEIPASFSHCSSPQRGLSGASRRQHHRQGEVPRGWSVCQTGETCLSVCSVQSLGLQPQDALHQLIESSHCSEQEGTILKVQELIFTKSKLILTKSRCVIEHISPSPVTSEHLGIPRAPH